MDRLNISILGISSTRWNNTGTSVINNSEYKTYRSINTDKYTNHKYSIAIIVNQKVEHRVTGFIPLR